MSLGPPRWVYALALGALTALFVRGAPCVPHSQTAAKIKVVTDAYLQKLLPQQPSFSFQQIHTSNEPQTCRETVPTRFALGVITAPNNQNRRVWMRQKMRVSEAECRGVRVYFVLGSRNHLTQEQKIALLYEQKIHGDILFVPARDYLPHAVAEKSLAWWDYASKHIPSKWYGKTDDDSLGSLSRLEEDIRVMEGMGRSHYYYGVMTWRAWIPYHTEPDGVCGSRGDDGPVPGGPSKTLSNIMNERKTTCQTALGPYPFADGSLQIISNDLVQAFVRSDLAQNYSKSHLNKVDPPFWTHEDAGVGYLIYHSTIIQDLPLTYVALQGWYHNKFWINWSPINNPELPNTHTVNTHKVVTPMMANIVLDAYLNTTFATDAIKCLDCERDWGWKCCHDSQWGKFRLDRIACCSKMRS